MSETDESDLFASRVARGAASELIAAAHMMARGYHVFRALAATCPVDLMAFRPGETPLRIEVKSVTVSGNRRHTWPDPRNDQWDLLIVVAPDGFAMEFSSDTTREERALTYTAAREPSGVLGPLPVRLGDRTHCARGHEFTAENTGRRNEGKGRFCKTCQRDAATKRRLRIEGRAA